MQNRKGFIGIIAILIVVVIAALWMGYLFKHNWFGVSSINGKANQQESVPAQLDDLRAQMKTIQDSKDKEINAALNDSGQQAQGILNK